MPQSTVRPAPSSDHIYTEECGRFDECAAYTGAYGGHVLQIEYPDSLAQAGMSFAQVRADQARGALRILRDRELDAAGARAPLRELLSHIGRPVPGVGGAGTDTVEAR